MSGSVFAKIWMTWLVDVTPNALGAMCRVILLLGMTMPNCMAAISVNHASLSAVPMEISLNMVGCD